MNATVEVAPTATTNCECKEEWYEQCDFGHDGGPTHCGGQGNPGGGPPLKPGCCFNYWYAARLSCRGMPRSGPTSDAPGSWRTHTYGSTVHGAGGETTPPLTESRTSRMPPPTMTPTITWPVPWWTGLKVAKGARSWLRSRFTTATSRSSARPPNERAATPQRPASGQLGRMSPPGGRAAPTHLRSWISVSFSTNGTHLSCPQRLWCRPQQTWCRHRR